MKGCDSQNSNSPPKIITLILYPRIQQHGSCGDERERKINKAEN